MRWSPWSARTLSGRTPSFGRNPPGSTGGWAELRGWFTKVVEPEVRGWFVLWIANGKITRRQVFLSRDDALEAAGLSE